MNFIPIEKERIPAGMVDTCFLIAHPYGIEYVYFAEGELKFAYTGNAVEALIPLSIITHWCLPENPNTYKPHE